MRLPAKNATAPVAALALMLAGAFEAGGQSIQEQGLPALRGDALPALPENGPVTRPAASPDPSASSVNVVPLSRAVPASPAVNLQTDAAPGADLWRGTPFSLVAEALTRLPVRVTSRVCRALTHEILTATADPSGGPWISARLAALRAERLYAMGQLEAAEAAFRAAGLAKGDPARGPIEIETKLLLHGPAVACAAVAEHRAGRRSLYLDRASVACHAMAGAHAKAAHGLYALRERGVALGDIFTGLVMAQQPDLARPFRSLWGADAWSVSLLAATNLPWPEDAMRLGSPALLRAVATSSNGPLGVRIGAAERAFLLGAIDHATLASLYGAARFRERALGLAASLTRGQYTPMRRAMLFQAAVNATDLRLRMAVLANWWRLARLEDGEMLAALATAPLVLDLRPAPEWREHAAAISRVLFHAGELDQALVWYSLLRDTDSRDMDSYIRLGAIAQLADGSGNAWTADEAQSWIAQQRIAPSGDRRVELMQALIEGFGAKRGSGNLASGITEGDAGIRISVTGHSASGRTAVWREVRNAAESGREGEAILLMLTALGHDGVARAEPGALGAAVGALATLGRRADARRLAVEAALANGF